MNREKAWRLRQRMMSAALRVMKQREPHLLEGPGSVLQIPAVLEEKGITRVMLVTSAGFIRRGTLIPLMDKLAGMDIGCEVFSEVMPDPSVHCAEKLHSLYKATGCEAFIAAGGGSVIDCTKIAAALCVRSKTVRQMRGTLQVMHKLPLLIAVPTTAGTGSEATAAAVITDTVKGVHYKYAVSDPCLIPHIAVLDPVLSLSLPPHHTAATGMDALTHAVEAYTNLYASDNVKKHALTAVKMIFADLEKTYEDGSDLGRRGRMLKASYEAGIAFTNNFVGYVHALSHACGALYGLGHGELNAAILPAVLEEYGEAVYGSLSEIAEAAGIEGQDQKERARNLISRIRAMNRYMGLDEKIRPLKQEDFEEIITRALSEANPAYPVPVIWGYKEAESVLRRLLAGNN
ncbi:MAG: iron-containing alcohol dehydrogenase [Solobacterium sp.]|nr:iron-containing alcohol dehydrogenase [Solobacterium sp.]